MSKFFKDWLYALIEASIIALILYVFFWPVNIDGSSMEPTFKDSDKAFISKIPILLKKINRGDIIVCNIKKDNYNKKIIKRVIAIGGDHLIIKEGHVILNNIILDEYYTIGTTDGNIDMIIPNQSMFVLGDNRQHSLDSRILGCIAYNSVLGKVLFPFK